VTWSAVDLGILLPPFLAGLLVIATHVPLGAQVLRKGIVFIDLAIAQIAALGVVVAAMFDVDPHGWPIQLAAAAAALAGALLLDWAERRWPQVQEAQIGVVFVLAATAGILLLSKNPHGGEHLRDLLAGQILWVGYGQLLVPLVATLLLVAAWFGLAARLSARGFYLLFALAVTVSVQLVGVYLVFASLIVPSLGARDWDERRRLPLAYAIGVGGYALGLVLSAALDLPSGALIVWCLALLAIAAHVAAPRRAAAATARSTSAVAREVEPHS
jgi:zinc/manganese transport system permease protein